MNIIDRVLGRKPAGAPSGPDVKQVGEIEDRFRTIRGQISGLGQGDRREELVALGPAAVPSFIQYLEAGPSQEDYGYYRVGGQVCEALGRLGGKGVFETLSRLFMHQSIFVDWDFMEEGAAKGLGYLADKRALPILKARAEASSAAQGAIMEALARLGEPQSINAPTESSPSVHEKIPPDPDFVSPKSGKGLFPGLTIDQINSKFGRLRDDDSSGVFRKFGYSVGAGDWGTSYLEVWVNKRAVVGMEIRWHRLDWPSGTDDPELLETHAGMPFMESASRLYNILKESPVGLAKATFYETRPNSIVLRSREREVAVVCFPRDDDPNCLAVLFVGHYRCYGEFDQMRGWAEARRHDFVPETY